MPDVLSMFDTLLEEDGPAAICIKQPLQSIEGPEAALIFPPTYAAPKDDSTKKPRYNIDELSSDNLTCSVDSVGSQANRVEPLFKRKKYSHLVPLVTVAHNGETTNLLDVGHRLADAIIRFSDLLADVHHAFEAYNKQREFAIKYRIYVILKGAYTSIATPDGEVYFNSTGNPGMATAGSGDTLTGILLGLLAQGYPPLQAAILGVYIHGLAGDIAAHEWGENALIAEDITNNLGKAFQHLTI